MLEWLNAINWQPLLIIAASAAAGGLVGFLWTCKTGKIRNNRHIRKGALEIVGGSIVGFFISLPIPIASESIQAGVVFCGGVGWATVVSVIRRKITAIVEAVFFGSLPASGPTRQEPEPESESEE